MFTSSAPLTAGEVLSAFEHDGPFLFLGAAFTSVAILCATLSLIRRKFDPLLLWLAGFAFLYGQRLWLDSRIVGIALAGLPYFGRIFWAVNFLTPVPAFLFFQTAGLLPPRKKLFTVCLISLFMGLAVA